MGVGTDAVVTDAPAHTVVPPLSVCCVFGDSESAICSDSCSVTGKVPAQFAPANTIFVPDKLPGNVFDSSELMPKIFRAM